MRAKSEFLAHLWKMKYIRRWGLMRNVESENLHEHSWQVAVTAHLLAVLYNEDAEKPVDPDRVAAAALFHEIGEAIVGDLPTPIKYFNQETQRAFEKLETSARDRLLTTLPSSMQAGYRQLVCTGLEQTIEGNLIKAADRLCAYIKCRQELKYGNSDFEYAVHQVRERLDSMDLPVIQRFLDEFIDAFELTIDELNR